MREPRGPRRLGPRGHGDGTGFGVLLSGTRGLVHKLCFRPTSDWALPEDLTSVVLSRALGRYRSTV